MKRLLSVILSVLLCVTMTIGISASAEASEHTNPNTGLPCNNTYYDVVHSRQIASYTATHEHTDGSTCYITYVVMEHTKRCSSCNAILYKYNKTCIESHSVCGKFVSDCEE